MSAADAQPYAVTLASASPYRRALLGRILSDFDAVAAGVDETPAPRETAAALAARLARAKLAKLTPERAGLVIGSDQAAQCGRDVLGKPGSADAAVDQLLRCSGQTVVFYTAVAVALGRGAEPMFERSHTDITSVRFRRLAEADVRRYVAADEPFDCAGGFRAESRGPVLFEAVTSTDPTGLIGLPLCWLAGALTEAGFRLPA